LSSTRRAGRRGGISRCEGGEGDPHKLIITLSKPVHGGTPLATQYAVNWRDLTPVQMMALTISFSGSTPRRLTRQQGIHRRGQGRGRKVQEGHGSKQEDQIITVAIGETDRSQVIYISYRGGGEVACSCRQARRFGRSTTHRSGGAVARRVAAALACRLQAHALQDEDHENHDLYDIPRARTPGSDVEYLMLARHFMPGG